MQPLVIQKLVNQLNKNIEGRIIYEDIQFTNLNSLIIKNIALIDAKPYIGKNQEKIDTLFKIKLLKANFSIKGLFQDKGLYVSKLFVDDAFLNLCLEKDKAKNSTNNIVRIFKIQSNNSKTSEKELFYINKIELKNFTFRLKNYNSSLNTHNTTSIDWADLDISKINLNARQLQFKGGYMSGILSKASFKEKSGLEITELRAKTVKVGKGKTLIKNFFLSDNHQSRLHSKEILFSYKNTASWTDFVNQVKMDIALEPSKVTFNTLSYFAPSLKDRDISAYVSGIYSGTVNKFELKDIHLSRKDSSLNARIKGSISNVTKADKMYFNLAAEELQFSLPWLDKFVHQWARKLQVNLNRANNKEYVTGLALVKGGLDSLSILPSLNFKEGSLDAKILIENTLQQKQALALNIEAQTKNLHFGKILSNDKLGRGSIDTKIRLIALANQSSIHIDSLKINSLQAMGYDYSNILLKGNYIDNNFSAEVYSKDPNLLFTYKGDIKPSQNDIFTKFEADIQRLNLKALNLGKDLASNIRFKLKTNMSIAKDYTVLGSLNIKDIHIEKDYKKHDIASLEIKSYRDTSHYNLKVDSENISLNYRGSRFLYDFYTELKDSVLLNNLKNYTLSTQRKTMSDYYLDIVVKNSNNLVSYLIPDLYVSDNSNFSMHLDKGGKLRARLKAKRIALNDKYLKDILLDIKHKEDSLVANLQSEEIKISPLILINNDISFNLKDNFLLAKINLNRHTTNPAVFVIKSELRLSPKDSLRISSSLESKIRDLQNKDWVLKANSIKWEKDYLNIDTLKISHNEQFITLSGQYSYNKPGKMQMRCKDIDLSLLNTLSSTPLSLRSTLDAEATLISPQSKGFGLTLNALFKEIALNNEPLGTVFAKSVWNKEKESFDFKVYNHLVDTNIYISGEYIPKQNSASANIRLARAEIAYAKTALISIFDDIRGKASGNIFLNLKDNNFLVKSDNIQVDDASLQLAYTKVRYDFKGNLALNENGLKFKKLQLFDRFGAEGSVSGGIHWNYFKDIRLDLLCKLDEMEAINTRYEDNPMIYGKVFGSGNVKISGDLDNILIDIAAKTRKKGEFNIVINNSNESKNNNLLIFKKSNILQENEKYLLSANTELAKKKSNLDIKIKLDVNQDTEAVLEIDKENQNNLRANGEGHIELDIRPNKDIFNINGNYNITQGTLSYKIALGENLPIFTKEFDIQKDSKIHFTGNLMKSMLDIKALYKTRADIGPLLADTTSTVQKDIYSYIKISSTLEKPQFNFSIEIPDLDHTNKSRVDNALNTAEKKQKQFFSLLLSNNFTYKQSAIINQNTLVYKGLSDLLSSNLNNLLHKLGIPIDININYSDNKNKKSLGTQINLSKRLSFRSNYNTQQKEIKNVNNYRGDYDLLLDLDKHKIVRLKGFYYSPDQYRDYLQNNQSFGMGIIFQLEFNRVKDIPNKIMNIFGKAKKKEEDIEFIEINVRK